MINRKFQLVCVISLIFGALSAQEYGHEDLSGVPRTRREYGTVVVDTVESVYDGDTLYVTIHGWHPIIGYDQPVRLSGIDTPEVRGTRTDRPWEYALAIEAKEFVENLLDSAESVELRGMQRGKYFRIVAEVWILSEGKWSSLGEELLRVGLAQEYDGKSARPEWEIPA